MREVHTLEEFDTYVAEHGSLDGVVVQGIDLTGRTEVILSLTCVGATFLGDELEVDAVRHVLLGGAAVFPRLPDLPFETYRATLYAQGELLEGWTPGEEGSYDRDTFDSKVYRWAKRHGAGVPLPVLDALAERLHDHGIDDALRAHFRNYPNIVAVMGGHSIVRADAGYRLVAELGRALAREGWHVATGGGPGAMEAANLGAWLAPHPDGALDDALSILAAEVDYGRADPYLAVGQRVLDRYPDGAASLAVPTWFYGHEPTNQFATHVAKYFANSIREDGLLAIATRGVVFAPGSAGTTQEVFQDATQNHYDVFGIVSPMVFLGSTFWREELPAEPLLRRLAGDRPYAGLIAVADTPDDVMAFLRAHPPVVST